MNEYVEGLVKDGLARLQAVREAEFEKNRREQEAAAEAVAERMRKFRAGLVALLGEPVVELLKPWSAHDVEWAAYPEMRLEVNGWLVCFNVRHKNFEQVTLHGSQPFMVPGLVGYPPHWDEEQGEVFPGMAEMSTAHDERMFFERLDMALAQAWENAAGMAAMQAEYAQTYEALKAQHAQKAQPVRVEPVYVAEELLDQPALNGIVNLDELVKLIRGIVEEYVQ